MVTREDLAAAEQGAAAGPADAALGDGGAEPRPHPVQQGQRVLVDVEGTAAGPDAVLGLGLQQAHRHAERTEGEGRGESDRTGSDHQCRVDWTI